MANGSVIVEDLLNDKYRLKKCFVDIKSLSLRDNIRIAIRNYHRLWNRKLRDGNGTTLTTHDEFFWDLEYSRYGLRRNGSRFGLTSDGSLTIRDITPEDFGEYICYLCCSTCSVLGRKPLVDNLMKIVHKLVVV